MRFLLILLALVIPCAAQTPSYLLAKPIKGTFFASVDDLATIYVNGEKVLGASYGVKPSAEMELKVGDRVVAHLVNQRGNKGFLLVFVASDGESLINFKRSDVKIVPEFKLTDFTAEQFKRWNKLAKSSPRPEKNLPFKTYSDWVWGETDKCILGALVTPQMITRKPN